MDIQFSTKLAVNNYMINNFTNKGCSGYTYVRQMLEYALESYKKIGYISPWKLSQLLKILNPPITYGACQRAVNYFLKTANYEGTFSVFIIESLEKIIETQQNNLLEGDEF